MIQNDKVTGFSNPSSSLEARTLNYVLFRGFFSGRNNVEKKCWNLFFFPEANFCFDQSNQVMIYWGLKIDPIWRSNRWWPTFFYSKKENSSSPPTFWSTWLFLDLGLQWTWITITIKIHNVKVVALILALLAHTCNKVLVISLFLKMKQKYFFGDTRCGPKIVSQPVLTKLANLPTHPGSHNETIRGWIWIWVCQLTF